MKKIIAILLAAMLTLPILASCGKDDVDTSSNAGDQSTASIDNSTEESSETDESSKVEESSGEPSEPDPEPISPQFKTLVSVGCGYTKSCKPGDSYPDTYDSELTDGVFAPDIEVGYGDSKLSGYAPTNGVVDVVIDLGEVYDNLHSFEGRFLLTRSAGIAPPGSVTVKASVDGKEFERVGALNACEYVESTMGLYTLDTKQYVTARYIMFSMTKAAAWIFLDELMVYADIESESNDAIFITDNITKIYAEDNADVAAERAMFETDQIPDRSLAKTCLSKLLSYRLAGTVLERYPDTKKLLSDGDTGSYYESGTWVGFDGKNDVDVVINLTRTDRKDLASFCLNAFASHSGKIYLPSCVIVYVSEDGAEYSEIGRAYSPVEYTDGPYEFAVELPKCIKAKYIRFVAKASGEGTMMFIDEVGVYAYRVVDDSSDPLYSAPVFENAGKITYFPSTESDYSTKQNLILGKKQFVTSGSVVTRADGTNNSKETVSCLTDGKVPTGTNIHAAEYFKSNRASKRSIIYDLGASCAVDSFSAVFLQFKSQAVQAPSSVSIELSQDAENWYVAGYITSKVDEDGLYDSELVLDKPVQAQYVRFSYPVSVWVGCGELRVNGKKNASGAVALADAGFKPFTIKTGYQGSDENLLKGVHDVALMYHSQSYNFTEDIFMPYLGYIDSEGKMQDVMFDGYLFLLSGNFPSGVRQHENSVKTDWEWQLKAIFAEGKNAMALESAAAKAKKEMNLPDDYKYKYYLSVYYPRVNATAFGDVDGDGKSENCSIFEDRQKVIKWYLDLALEYDKNANFKNIELGGFYWFHEAVESEDDSVALINMVSNETQARGYDLFWIPYFNSSGTGNWTDYGFATACMQPNYVFDLKAPISNIKNAANTIQQNGMCIELEIDSKAISQKIFYDRYMEYLKGGVYYGYMKDCIHMYYQEMQIFYNACNSQNPMSRSIYDYTYQFIKGTLDIYPDKVADVKAEATADSILLSKLECGDKSEKFVVTLAPEHGTVTIESDGTYRYYPNKGFKGTDRFEYKYSNGLDFSDSCKVEITVK